MGGGPMGGPGMMEEGWTTEGGPEGFPGPGGLPPPPAMMSPKQVLCWLDMQDNSILRRVYYHCKFVMEQASCIHTKTNI